MMGGHHGDDVTGPLTRVQPPEGTLPQPHFSQHVCREESTAKDHDIATRGRRFLGLPLLWQQSDACRRVSC